MKVLVLDTETGGLDPTEYSLLTVGAVVLDLHAEALGAELAFYVKENIIATEPEAMTVNRVDLAKVRTEGLSPLEAVEKLVAFVNLHFDGRVILAGHNVDFDQAFLRRLWRLAGPKAPNWPFFYAKLDTASLGWMQKIKDAGWPYEQPRLDALLNAYMINIPTEDRHTAIGDARGTAKLLIEMTRGNLHYVRP